MLCADMSALRRPQHAQGQPGPSRDARQGEAGFTIVEMLVASFILGLGIMGVAGLIVASSRNAGMAETQNDASALANGELEIIRSLDYDFVGIATSADGYVREVDGLPTVSEAAGNLVEPYNKVSVDDQTFVIERSVTWATVSDNREAYKIVRIVVFWETTAGSRSLTVQTGLHEGLFGA